MARTRRQSVAGTAMNGNPSISEPLDGRPIPPTQTIEGHAVRSTFARAEEEFDFDHPNYHASQQTVASDPTLLSNGSRSLSGIAISAFVLGIVLATCVLTALLLVLNDYTFWRFPCFIGLLSLFHFLEFYITARYNLPAARVSSYLLFTNGRAYNIAHLMASMEILLSFFSPWYQSLCVSFYTTSIGIFLVILGQVTRSIAMAHAGTNFNHTPAKELKEGHELVTTGIYSYLRHPSYFGFFWWALGTQILAGNKVCTLGYAYVLWDFFDRRIRSEEKLLITFFGNDYAEYRKRTRTGIPFVR